MSQALQPKPAQSDHSTKALSSFMKHLGAGNAAYKGLSNFSVMSLEMQKFFLYTFDCQYGPIILVEIDTMDLSGRYVTPVTKCMSPEHPERRAILLINQRHVASARYSKEAKKILVRDTSHTELLASGRRLIYFLNESNLLTPGRRVEIVFDTKTPQQPVDCGGCCVMSLANHLKPDTSYAAVEDGEAIRKEYGKELVYFLITSNYTMLDAQNLFHKRFTPSRANWTYAVCLIKVLCVVRAFLFITDLGCAWFDSRR